jgi:Arylsulfotransferase (ASST)
MNESLSGGSGGSSPWQALIGGSGGSAPGQGLSRRDVLRVTGTAAAAAAGLGLVACGTSNASPGQAKNLQHFVSRPDLTPPKVTLRHVAPDHDLQYLFLGIANSGPGQGGAMIMDTNGELIWFSPDAGQHASKMDFQRQVLHGKPVLTWFEGRVVAGGYGLGVAKIADTSYQITHTIHAHNGLQVDEHEFNISPQGTALISAFHKQRYDLSKLGGPRRGWLLSGQAQEIDIASGDLLFSWESLDHVGFDETYLPVQGGHGTKAKPYDYFHINTIQDAGDGDLLIGARNTWCVYKVSRKTGEIVWRLNGKKTDFTMAPGSEFYWQHDTRLHDRTTLTVFDDGYDGVLPKNEKQSRALILDVDYDRMLVTLRKEFTHPGALILSKAMGNAQMLPGGGMFVGWGTNPYFSEFDAQGRLILDGVLVKGDPTYRSFIGDWAGYPAEKPVAAVRHRAGGAVVYASWNGSTELASWNVLAGKTKTSLAKVAHAPKKGFETAIAVQHTGPYFAVEPSDAKGRELSRSDPVRLS